MTDRKAHEMTVGELRELLAVLPTDMLVGIFAPDCDERTANRAEVVDYSPDPHERLLFFIISSAGAAGKTVYDP